MDGIDDAASSAQTQPSEISHFHSHKMYQNILLSINKVENSVPICCNICAMSAFMI